MIKLELHSIPPGAKKIPAFIIKATKRTFVE